MPLTEGWGDYEFSERSCFVYRLCFDLMKQIADSGNIGRLTYEEAKKVVIEEVEEAFWKTARKVHKKT